MITAIMFGSAVRRWCGENIISRYQMTVLVEALFAETLLFEDSRRRVFLRRPRTKCRTSL